MVFSSLEFLFLFLPLVALLYFLCPGKLRNGLLLLASLLFYAWGEPVYVLVMLASILMNYGFGRLVDKYSGKARKTALAFGVALNLLMLGVFKYTGFVMSNLRAVTGLELPMKEIALPIGISFFTFQAMSYVIDVYREKAAVQKNIFSFGLYISLFPQLIAGPIVRYSTVAEQIVSRRTTPEMAAQGLKRFLTGLAKKVLLANSAGLLWTQLTEGGSALPAADAWLAAISFSLQIYFDFSGYSDMAIGLGLLFGFRFEENFNYPYISSTITEFWSRWHMSLGTWFKEYVYIPLGGNRKGKAKQIRNILIVWLLTGLWHGASWNFILWGVYYGLLLLAEKLLLKKLLEKAPAAVRRLYTLLAVLFGWVLFANEDFTGLGQFLAGMFGANGGASPALPGLLAGNVLLLCVAAFASLPLGKKLAEGLRKKCGGSAAFFCAETLWYLLLFLLSVASLVNSSYNPFIYFRF